MNNVFKKFPLVFVGPVSAILNSFLFTDTELNNLYYLLSLSPLIDLSVNSRIFKGESLSNILFNQLIIGVVSAILFRDIIHWIVYLSSRQMLLSVQNYFFVSSKYKMELRIRLFLQVQVLIIGLIYHFTSQILSIIVMSCANLILVLSCSTIRGKFSLNQVVSLSNAAVIIGALTLSSLYKIVEVENTILVILGLQSLNMANTVYNVFKENIYKAKMLKYFEYYLVRLGFITSLTSVITTAFLDSIEIFVFLVLVLEILQIHFMQQKIQRGSFDFVPRLALFTLSLFVYSRSEVFYYPLLLSSFIIYYLINFISFESTSLDTGKG